MSRPNGSLLIIAAAMAVAACGPSDPMHSREAKECQQLLPIQESWGDVGVEAEKRVQGAKTWNADPSLVTVYGKRSENVSERIDQIMAERDRAVASCVLKMKGGR